MLVAIFPANFPVRQPLKANFPAKWRVIVVGDKMIFSTQARWVDGDCISCNYNGNWIASSESDSIIQEDGSLFSGFSHKRIFLSTSWGHEENSI